MTVVQDEDAQREEEAELDDEEGGVDDGACSGDVTEHV